MDAHALVRRFTDICTSHQVSNFAEVITEGYRQHNPMVEDGLSGIQVGFDQFLTAFPDLTATLETVMAEGDMVAARITWRGTHQGDFLGIPASGRVASWTSADWWRIEEGLLCEHWDVVDWAGLMDQITAEPTAEEDATGAVA